MPQIATHDFVCHYADDYFGPAWDRPETVLIQAGFGRNGEYWRHWVPDLARLHRVIRRDMRAHGGSSAGDQPWSVELLAADVVAFLDALGLESVHYVGESVGGITGIALGALHGDRFRSITLVQTPIRLGPLLQDAMRRDFGTWSEALRTLGPGGWVTQNMDPAAPRTRWERAQWDRCDVAALARLADATLHVDVEHYLPLVVPPTLILAPGASALTSLADQWQMRTSIPRCEIDVYEGMGHNIYNEAAPRAIARVLAFVAQHSVPDSAL